MTHLKQEKGFYKGVLRLMLPMMVQNFVSQSMAFADTFMVGLLGETQLAAVTAATTPFFIVMLVCFGFQSGASVMASQYNGMGNRKVINRILGMSWMTALSVTTIVAVVARIMPMQILGILTNNESLHAPGAEYVEIIGFSYIFFAISGIYTAIQRALGNPKLGAYLFTISGILNVFLNWMLIFGNLGAPAMGIRGAAVATVLSRAFEVVVVLIYMNRDKLLKPDYKLIFKPGKTIAKDFFRVAMPVGLNELLWSTSMSLFAVIMGHMPDSTSILAAHTISGNIEKLLSVAIMAGGGATAIVVGTEIGKGNSQSAYGKAVALNFIALITGAISGILIFIIRFFVAGRVIFPLMGLGEEAQGIAMFILGAMMLIQPLRALNMTNIVGVFRGGGDVVYALVADIAPMYILCIPAAALCGLVFNLGIIPVYLCVMVDEVLKFLITLPRLYSGKWINNITRENA